MKAALLIIVLVAMSVTAASAVVLMPFTNDGVFNVSLQVERNPISGGWNWIYTLQNGSAEQLQEFTAGLVFNDTPLGTATGHITNYQSSQAGFVASETATAAIWDFPGNKLATGGATATFSFDTDLPSISLAADNARDTNTVPVWVHVPTPSAAIPEPMSLMLGTMGLSTVAAMVRLRRKK